jgi:hypothetical protein
VGLVEFPAVVNRIDQILPAARAVIDADGERAAADPDISISCRPGCTVCCHQAVVVTGAELRAIHDAVARLSEPDRSVVQERISSQAQQLRDAGITGDSLVHLDPADAMQVVQRYFALRVMCPLLADGVCIVRDERPLVCREYLVTSDPAECARLGQSAQIVRIRARRDIVAGFRSASAATGEARRHLLAPALDDPRPADPRPVPMSAGALIERMTGSFHR